jgi:hypothetical protein
MLCVTIMVFMLRVVKLNVVMLSVIRLNVVAPYEDSSECLFAKNTKAYY